LEFVCDLRLQRQVDAAGAAAREPAALIGRLDVTVGQRELLLDSHHGKGSG
jgi:hypothetical protein